MAQLYNISAVDIFLTSRIYTAEYRLYEVIKKETGRNKQVHLYILKTGINMYAFETFSGD